MVKVTQVFPKVYKEFTERKIYFAAIYLSNFPKLKTSAFLKKIQPFLLTDRPILTFLKAIINIVIIIPLVIEM